MLANEDITNRALRFARTFTYSNPRITATRPGRDLLVARFGTPNSTEYLETEIHMDWEDQQQLINSSKPVDRPNVESLLQSGVDLLVVCSATDVIYHEFLGIDLD